MKVVKDQPQTPQIPKFQFHFFTDGFILLSAVSQMMPYVKGVKLYSICICNLMFNFTSRS